MPPLRSPRRELFCQTVVKNLKNGGNYTDAYRQAGYRGDQRTLEVGASRLMSFDEVQMRIDELTRPAAKKARVSVESLLAELETTITDARAAKQHGTVVQALTLSAKLVGLLRDRLEVGGVGEFDQLETPEAVADAFLVDMEPAEALATLDVLRGLIEQRAGNRAITVQPPMAQDETAAALRELRPSQRNGRAG
jgi:hypothetical protein